MPMPPRENVRQLVIAEITSNTTTNSATFVTLLSSTLTTSDSFLLITFTMSCSNTTTNDYTGFRVSVDGTPYFGARISNVSTGAANAGGLVFKIAVSAGSHTVLIQWLAGGGGTAQIRPLGTSAEHARMIIKEVFV